MNAPRRQEHGLLACALLALFVYGTSGSTAEIPARVLKAEQQRITVMQKAAATSISVFDGTGQGGGSGVVVTADGYALSNFHVTSPSGAFMKCGLPDGRVYDAVVVGLDPTGDVALIKLVERDDFPNAVMGDSDTVRTGDWCFAAGNPFLLATDMQPSISFGIVSGIHRYQYPSGTLLEYADCIQTDAAINPGNSGGPLFNESGELIGVNGRGSFEKRGRVNVGVGYSISINQIKNFMGYLRSGRIVDHATLGASVSTDDEGRVVITNILQNSDVYRRGLRYGDEVVRFAGRSISSVNGFKNVLGTLPKGWRVPLSYRQNGVRYDRMVRLAGVHAYEELLAKAASKLTPPMCPDQHPEDNERPQRPAPSRRKLSSKVPGDVPDGLARFYTARRGYANYYFNVANRGRVWDAFMRHSQFFGRHGIWVANGELQDGRSFHVDLDADRAAASLDTDLAHINGALDLSSQLEPKGSGGFLAALHVWRRLLTLGPRQFGDVYYLGTAPLSGRDGLCDVLIAIHDVVESWFYFDPSNGQLLLMEMYPDRDVDPCELYFSEYSLVDRCLMPHRIEIRYGNTTFGVITINRWDLAVEAEKA